MIPRQKNFLIIVFSFLSLISTLCSFGYSSFFFRYEGLIFPLFLLAVACIPAFRRHRKTWVLSICTVNIVYLILTHSDLSNILTLAVFVMCILIALWPNRGAKGEEEPQPTQAKKATSCPTCGSELWADGRCPDCYDRMVLLNWLQETGQLPSKTTRHRQNSLGSDLR